MKLLTYRVYDLDTGEVTLMYAKTARNLMRRLGSGGGRFRVNLIKRGLYSPEADMFHGGERSPEVRGGQASTLGGSKPLTSVSKPSDIDSSASVMLSGESVRRELASEGVSRDTSSSDKA